MRKVMNDERGAVFVEATLVFPIMFFVLFILIYFGNAFYLRSCVDSLVMQESVKGAAYCADPLLMDVLKQGKVPTTTKDLSTKIQPYSGIFGNNNAETMIKNELETRLNGIGSGFFDGMAPVRQKVSVKYHNYLVVSNFAVEVDYRITLPIRFIGSDEPLALQLHAKSVQPVNDTPDFIRDLDMIKDYSDRSGLTEKIHNVFSKVGKFFGSLGGSNR